VFHVNHERWEIVVLGWWAANQQRSTFVRILQAELGLSLGEAKRRLDHQLESTGLIVLRFGSRERALDVGTRIAECGAEVRLLTRDSVGAEDENFDAQHLRLIDGLRTFVSGAPIDAARRRAAAAMLFADLRLPAPPFD
jgi:hypothetical protein